MKLTFTSNESISHRVSLEAISLESPKEKGNKTPWLSTFMQIKFL